MSDTAATPQVREERTDMEQRFEILRSSMIQLHSGSGDIDIQDIKAYLNDMAKYSLLPGETCPTVEEKFLELQKTAEVQKRFDTARRYKIPSKREEEEESINDELFERAIEEVMKHVHALLQARKETR